MNGDLARFLDLEPGDLRDDSLPDSKQSLQDLQVHVDVLLVEKQRAEHDRDQSRRMLLVLQEQLTEHANEQAFRVESLVAHATSSLTACGTHERIIEELSEFGEEARLFSEQQRRDYAHARGQPDETRGRDLHYASSNRETAREPARNEHLTQQIDGKMEDNEEEEDLLPMDDASDMPDLDLSSVPISLPSTSLPTVSFAERAKYIPLRLTLGERRLLRLLEGALAVSEYTDKVDIITWKNKAGRIHAQIKYLCAIMCGLVVAEDFNEGQRLIKDRNFVDNAGFFQDCFEVGRRYKVMNPDRLRSDYGKLMYMLMDASDPNIHELLEYSCVSPMRTVARYLEEKGAIALLHDPLLGVATAEVTPRGRANLEIRQEIRTKERTRDALAKKYATSTCSSEDLLQCMYAMGDNNTYLAFNRDPIDQMICHLTTRFTAHEVPNPAYSLAIQSGRGGARLTHNHQRQYAYVLQSLTLWREIQTDMFKLWMLAEEDLLDPTNRYRLADTGQGLNRVQQAPRTYRAMTGIVARCQQRIGSWVGSSFVHMGDHNVPNAFMFIDKYTQVPRILSPMVLVLESIPKVYVQDKHVKNYVDAAFGSLDDALMTILTDFFRHAFDGSGADSFFDAGSCIDGRLTSAWNWTSTIEKKPYWMLFKMSGFVGFDGEFGGK